MLELKYNTPASAIDEGLFAHKQRMQSHPGKEAGQRQFVYKTLWELWIQACIWAYVAAYSRWPAQYLTNCKIIQ